jgi:molybdopterin-biosynthesis enzyme MoeA-like protein
MLPGVPEEMEAMFESEVTAILSPITPHDRSGGLWI